MPTDTALPLATAADITQIYDAYALLPKPDPTDPEPTPVYPDPAAAPAGALPASLEFDGAHGRIIQPLEAVPSENLLNHSAVLALVPSGVQTIKLDEEEDGEWNIYLQGDDIHSGARFALPKEELRAMLVRDGIQLYGRPSEEALATLRAEQAAAREAEEAAAKAAKDKEIPPF